jgi:hypothetical protein
MSFDNIQLNFFEDDCQGFVEEIEEPSYLAVDKSPKRRIVRYVATDSEWEDNQAITVQMATRTMKRDVFGIYSHPSLKRRDGAILRAVGVDSFKTVFAPLDFLGFKEKDVDVLIVDEMTREIQRGYKYKFHIRLSIFWTAMDVRNLFKDDDFYRRHVARYLTRESRTRFDNSGSGTISLPIVVKTWDGVKRLVTMEIVDISSMQDKTSGLFGTAANVGINMDSKTVISTDEKSKMLTVMRERTLDFVDYAMGDVRFDDDGVQKSLLHEIEKRTREFYSNIANSNGINLRPDEVALTVGSTVAKILTKFLKGMVGFDAFVGDRENMKWDSLIGLGSPQGILDYSTLVKDKGLGTYGLMVDGGRAVSASQQNVFEGVLIDIDISGCYGNGLMNQVYPVGKPTIVNEKNLTLRACLKKYEKELVPGLWTMRISTTEKLTFEQSLILSKMEGRFLCWENSSVAKDEGVDRDGDERVADTSMVLTRREIKHGLLNHDILQVIKSVGNQRELREILDNCIVESLIFYPKSCEVKSLRDDMFENTPSTVKIDRRGNLVTVANKHSWIGISLKDFIEPLSIERKKHPKKTPMNTFIKLIINTTYGVIASQYFFTEVMGCSNVVVGNNITARARALAYLMEAGLGTKMSITDGGVLDYNKVPHWVGRYVSLHNVSRMFFGECCYRDKQQLRTLLSLKPLSTAILTREEVLSQNIDVNSLDKVAWEHLKKTFSGIDILDSDQFSFESKTWAFKLIRRSKCDYLLETPKGTTTALRGLPKYLQSGVGKSLFAAIEENNPTVVRFTKGQPYTPKQYRNDLERTGKHPVYLPDEFLSYDRKLFSHTPLGNHFETYADYEEVISQYERMKEEV